MEVAEASDPAGVLLRYEVVYGFRARIKSKNVLCSPQAYFNGISDFNVDVITKYTFQCVPANGSPCSPEKLAKLEKSSFEIFDAKVPNTSLIDGLVDSDPAWQCSYVHPNGW